MGAKIYRVGSRSLPLPVGGAWPGGYSPIGACWLHRQDPGDDVPSHFSLRDRQGIVKKNPCLGPPPPVRSLEIIGACWDGVLPVSTENPGGSPIWPAPRGPRRSEKLPRPPGNRLHPRPGDSRVAGTYWPTYRRLPPQRKPGLSPAGLSPAGQAAAISGPREPTNYGNIFPPSPVPPLHPKRLPHIGGVLADRPGSRKVLSGDST